mmetsp:Transcript_69001/g.114680  ORF Transcript_69001/g.114680 Transcript_69001/m.114680 type:complete len:268 (+) Transcript_69001:51-854(+)|eukprot:CAMPEP_0119311236 /NCGR_PEP_ID=MMETSP1333-20130426/21993_1 /TAXON_ID=418940 /ORGANISM="Scyphosphaera apsteinii, Strain RCC1455" /LENGTH=267 /DNA_ID=CAMNT_0007315571 /DNA_START=47 /DNA_END=850 /DNA_ORIENTATION=-
MDMSLDELIEADVRKKKNGPKRNGKSGVFTRLGNRAGGIQKGSGPGTRGTATQRGGRKEPQAASGKGGKGGKGDGWGSGKGFNGESSFDGDGNDWSEEAAAWSTWGKGGWAKGKGKGAGKGSSGKGGKGATNDAVLATIERSSEEQRLHNQMTTNRQIISEGGETIVKLYDTTVVRIGTADIVLDSGGFQIDGGDDAAETLMCINETLSDYGYAIKAKGDQWQVTDGKFRLLRFVDGMTLAGAVTDAKKFGPASTAARIPSKRFAPY